MKEVWKPVKGYEGLYEVSNCGRVKSLERVIQRRGKFGNQTVHERIKAQEVSNKGYMMVNLHKGNKGRLVTVHRLVAEAFIPNDDPFSKNIINHKDENPRNNNVENLEWCDAKYNQNYGNIKDKIRETLCSRHDVKPVRLEATLPTGKKRLYPSAKSAANDLGVCVSAILKRYHGELPNKPIKGISIRFISEPYHDKYLEKIEGDQK